MPWNSCTTWKVLLKLAAQLTWPERTPVSRAADDRKRPRAPLGIGMGLLNAEALERDHRRKLERTRELLAQKDRVVKNLVIRTVQVL
jgi:hypothetical protein